MANWQLREKLKKITEATKQENNLSERTKNAGLIVFLVLFGIAITVLFALSVGLLINGHLIGAIVIFSIAALLTYSIVQLMRADNIRQL